MTVNLCITRNSKEEMMWQRQNRKKSLIKQVIQQDLHGGGSAWGGGGSQRGEKGFSLSNRGQRITFVDRDRIMDQIFHDENLSFCFLYQNKNK